jgi:hypothetical protein
VYGMILLKQWVMLKGVLLIVSGTIDTFHTYNNGVDFIVYIPMYQYSTAVLGLSDSWHA